MLELSTTKPYRKSLNKLAKSGNFDGNKLITIVNKLLRGDKLEQKHRDHQLNGRFANYRECHIENDLILIYEISVKENYLELVDIGSHSDLFG